MNKISVFVKTTPQNSLALLPYEAEGEDMNCEPGSGLSPEDKTMLVP